MRNPNFASLAEMELRDTLAINLDDFNFSDIVWQLPDSDNNEGLPEAEVKIKIDDKVYCCKLKKWVGHVTQEINFELFEDKNFEDCILEGTIQFSIDTEAVNAVDRAFIKRKPNKDKENSALPVGKGIEFYKKELDFIKDQSKKYTHGLLHKVVHDPREGLTPEKWNKTFEPVLVDREYQKITEGKWQRLYKEADQDIVTRKK